MQLTPSRTVPKRVKRSCVGHNRCASPEHGGYLSLDRHGDPINNTVYYSFEAAEDAGGRVVRRKWWEKNFSQGRQDNQ